MRSAGKTSRDYVSFAAADLGVRAIASWLEASGYDDMIHGRRTGAGASAAASTSRSGEGGPAAGAENGMAFDPHSLWDKHTKHCVKCRQAVANIAAGARVLQAAGMALAVVALALAAGGLGAAPAVAAALLAAGAWFARRRLVRWGREGYVSSRRQWEDAGGLSLAKPAWGAVGGLSDEDVSLF